MSMIDIIKKASVGAVGAGNPVIITFGEVLEVNELKIKLNQKSILTKEFFTIPETLTRYVVTISGNEVVIRDGLNIGDKVLLIRIQGSSDYIILDKVV